MLRLQIYLVMYYEICSMATWRFYLVVTILFHCDVLKNYLCMFGLVVVIFGDQAID